MEKIVADASGILEKSNQNWCTPQEARQAFKPGRITSIYLLGSDPVAWEIGFDTDLGEGEAYTGMLQGKDLSIENGEIGIF